MSTEQNQSNQDSRGEKEEGHGESGVQSHQNASPEQEQAQKSGDHLGNDHEDAPGPAGGYDSTQIQHHPPGFDIRITFNRATALPISDMHTMNSDPYINAEFKTDLPTRHKEDPPLKFRSHTVFNNTEPVWDAVWQLSHVPASGFHLKARIYDEDANDRDDRLGNVHIHVGPISENWEGMKNQGFKIKKRSGSKRAYMLRAVVVAMQQKKEMSGELFVTIELLGRSKGEEGGRVYTSGPNYWYKHYSLLLGRIANSRAPDEDTDSDESSEETQNGRAPDGEVAGNKRLSVENPDKRRGSAMSKSSNRSSKSSGGKDKPGKYRFQANQFQLRGPVPAELYHRYVDFRPIISNLFTSKGIRGFILHKALHHQHGMVYNFSTTTKHGVFDHPSYDMTRQFLDMVHHDEGGRIHTYVITLDGLMRFTETGKEFGIDFLSKHTMHSDASIYIAYSGEFFIRRLKNPHQPPPEQAQAAASHGANMDNPNDQSNAQNGASNHHGALPSHSRAASTTGNDTHPPASLDGGPPKDPPPHDPRYYELIIDNDSGTYRPNAKLLPVLASFLSSNFPGLKITTLDCQADEELMGKLKGQQRERKKAEGVNVVMTQMPRGKHMNSRHRGKNSEDEEGGSSGSSLSSSDEERLQHELEEDREEEAHEPHAVAEAAAPFAGNVMIKQGLKGQLGWQKKLRGLGHKD